VSPRQRPVGRVEHQRGVDTVEESGVERQYLAAATLFSRGTNYAHRATVGQNIAQRRSRHCRARADQVMPAGVPDLGKSVVFGDECHPGSAGAAASNKGGL
jgi:hypothetical protein